MLSVSPKKSETQLSITLFASSVIAETERFSVRVARVLI